MIFQLYDGVGTISIQQETVLQSLNFNLFPGLVISHDAGQLPVSHTRGTNRPSYCILCFMFQIASCL